MKKIKQMLNKGVNRGGRCATHHSLVRVYERTGVRGDSAVRFISNARKLGHDVSFFSDTGLEDIESFRRYLSGKECAGKKVKVYGDYVFVLNKSHDTGTGCVTMYPVPSFYADAVKSYLESCVTWKVRFNVLHPKRICFTRDLAKFNGHGNISDVHDVSSPVFSLVCKRFNKTARKAGLCEDVIVFYDGTIRHNGVRVGTWEVIKCLKKKTKIKTNQ